VRPLQFAEPLIAARRARKRPDGLVIIADGLHGLHRRFPENFVLRADLGTDPTFYDAWYLAGLDVEVATVAPMRRCLRWEAAIMRARPFYLRWWLLDIDALVRVWPPHPFGGRYFIENRLGAQCS
jgi:hypothetical protein